MSLAIKVHVDNEIRKINLEKPFTFRRLQEIVNQRYFNNAAKNLVFKYEDDEGERISLGSDEDFIEAIRIKEHHKMNFLRIFVQEMEQHECCLENEKNMTIESPSFEIHCSQLPVWGFSSEIELNDFVVVEREPTAVNTPTPAPEIKSTTTVSTSASTPKLQTTQPISIPSQPINVPPYAIADSPTQTQSTTSLPPYVVTMPGGELNTMDSGLPTYISPLESDPNRIVSTSPQNYAEGCKSPKTYAQAVNGDVPYSSSTPSSQPYVLTL
eukprot:TRINITY_DN4315_c0_g1_i1.p1 TRINITY_DN4315_c0_g1~~TRINITY_DN4315_c0_g1_i1.p1  ORF type:complete len:291 (+),score=98.94 TRINITY_DN4315_c0_g1_i1:69-875(+)